MFRGVAVPSASASRPGGRPPSVSLPPSPLARCVVSRPAGVPVSRPHPERVRDHPALPGVAPRCRVCVGGPAAAPHPLSSARPRPPAWNRGVVSRRGASRGSASVSRRPGGSRRVASPGSGHPPPSSRSSLPLVRPRPAVRAPLAPRGGVTGGLRGFPSFPRAAAVRGSRLSPRPPSRVRGSSVLRVLRSLAPARLGLARRQAGRPAAEPFVRPAGRLASSRSYLVDPASSICLSQRLSHACLSTHGRYSETANGSLNQLWFLWSLAPLLLG